MLARVPDGTPLGAAAGAAIALQLAEALDHAHRRGVVHRELNPERVLLSREGTVKLTGFSVHLDDGVAALPEAVDVTGVRSAGYLAPEQILGEGADPRGDLFSLGVILYELVGGRCPFIGEGDVSTAQRDAFRMGTNMYVNLNAESEEEARRLFEGLAAGGRVEMDLTSTSWAALYGSLVDRFGVPWMVNLPHPR